MFEYFYQNNNGDTTFAAAKLNSAIDCILRLDCCLEQGEDIDQNISGLIFHVCEAASNNASII